MRSMNIKYGVIASRAFINAKFLQPFLDKLFLQHLPLSRRAKSRSEKERMIDT